jgi:transcriptional regulator with XRE-family HTH domain
MVRTSEQRVQDIKLVGEVVYGSRFGLPMAERLGIAQSQISRFLSGLRSAPDGLDDKLLEILDEEVGIQELKLAQIKAIRAQVGERIAKARSIEVPLEEQSITYRMLQDILDEDET